MSPSRGRNLIVDTGYWYALFDPRDPMAAAARAKADTIEEFNVVLPWPTLYETLRTRFVKNAGGTAAFERVLRRPNVTLLDDKRYRDRALDATLEGARLGRRAISLCDMLIRLIIDDNSVRIAAVLTFNIRDFQDVCRARSVEIL